MLPHPYVNPYDSVEWLVQYLITIYYGKFVGNGLAGPRLKHVQSVPKRSTATKGRLLTHL